MAASFPYNSEDYQPPAPLLSLSASVPFLDTRAEEVHALCGTGADICCLPRMLVERLGLIEVDEIEVAGYEGPSQRKPVFAVQIRIEGKAPLIVRVLSINRPKAILGRDLLNSLRLEFDGPRESLTLL